MKQFKINKKAPVFLKIIYKNKEMCQIYHNLSLNYINQQNILTDKIKISQNNQSDLLQKS